MAEGKKSLEEQMEYLSNMKWVSDDRFDRVFMMPEETLKCEEYQSNLRRSGTIDKDLLRIIRYLIKEGRLKYIDFKEKLRNQPRRDAQKFIGNKVIRKLIFDKYGNVCLCCGSINNLTIDHIVPIYHKGLNEIDNLQPLCGSCNSSKGTKIIDYRN